MSGAKTLFNRLVYHGVKNVFGYPGGAILPVLNEFHDQNKIRFILSRTEAGASLMAEGYAKSSGNLGVVMTTSGPGALNITNSLQNALSDGTPILALTGQVSTEVLGTNAFQEADIIGITKPCTKWNMMIRNGSSIDLLTDDAIRAAFHGRPGPVLLDLPKNLMAKPAGRQDKQAGPDEQEFIQPTISAEQIITALQKAERPVILAGQGSVKAYNELRKFAEKYNVPVTTTLLGLGIMDEKSPLSLKMLGMHGSFYANKAIHNSDLLLNFGSRFDDRIIGNPESFAPNAQIVHVDISKDNINKVIKTPHYIHNDCKVVLKELLAIKADNELKIGPWLNQIQQWKKTQFSYAKTKQAIQGAEVIATLNKVLQKNRSSVATIVADVGAHQMWAAQHIDYDYNKVRFITSGGLGTMGFALPAAIGVKIANPDQTVICICGDGGFTMSFVELLTAIESKTNIKVFIINNNYQLMVKIWQEKFYDNRITGVRMNNPPFEIVCKALGCESKKVVDRQTLEKDIAWALDYNNGPVVINFITEENESVLPMVSPGKSLDEMILNETNPLTGEAPC
jgi:acetolactate synthase-1/2/3 large subunit